MTTRPRLLIAPALLAVAAAVVLAVALLVGAVTVRVAGISTAPLRPAFDRVVPVPAALAGACAAFAVSAVTHEVLHYRHLWAPFGVIAALHLHGRAGPPVPDQPTGELAARRAARAV